MFIPATKVPVLGLYFVALIGYIVTAETSTLCKILRLYYHIEGQSYYYYYYYCCFCCCFSVDVAIRIYFISTNFAVSVSQ